MTEEHVPGPVNCNVDLLRNLVVLRCGAAQDMFRRADEVQRDLHLADGAKERPVLGIQGYVEVSGPDCSVEADPRCRNLSGDMGRVWLTRLTVIHRTTSVLSSSLSERM